MEKTSASFEKPVVVVSAHTMALAAIRALGEAGVPVFVLRHDARDMAHVSRHVRAAFSVPAPQDDEEAFVAAVARYAQLFRGAMLLPASDEALAAVSRHKERLARDYVVACPDWAVTRTLIEKRRTYALAAGAGVPVPVTLEPASLEEACAAAARLGYPLLVKPSQSHLFAARFGRKMALVHDDAELAEHFGAALRARIDVVLQEVVPGDDGEAVNYNAYRCEGRPAVEFTARQLRKAPPRFGSPRAVVSARVDEVLEPGRRMLDALGLEGFACIELKRDARDGRYKVLDVNGRPNLSGILAVRCGVNFPLLQYRHLMYGEPPRAGPAAEGVYWTDVFRDAAYTLRYGRSERRPLRSYVAPYLARHCDATVELADLRPALARARWMVRASASLPRRALAAASPPPALRAPEARATVAHVMTTPASLHFLRGAARLHAAPRLRAARRQLARPARTVRLRARGDPHRPHDARDHAAPRPRCALPALAAPAHAPAGHRPRAHAEGRPPRHARVVPRADPGPHLPPARAPARDGDRAEARPPPAHRAHLVPARAPGHRGEPLAPRRRPRGAALPAGEDCGDGGRERQRRERGALPPAAGAGRARRARAARHPRGRDCRRLRRPAREREGARRARHGVAGAPRR